MKNSAKFDYAFRYFKKPYAYKMGGTQTVILPNGKSKIFDNREYYSGRGAKYNNSIKHDSIGDVKVSKEEYKKFLAMLKDREQQARVRQMEIVEKAKKYKAFQEKGLYGVEEGHGTKYIVLSQEEENECYFDAYRLARTLKIKVSDALLLNSKGKTYVFAKNEGGKTMMLYHSSIFAGNSLFISISEPDEEFIKSFNHSEWANAPYSSEVGMTEKSNHFVC